MGTFQKKMVHSQLLVRAAVTFCVAFALPSTSSIFHDAGEIVPEDTVSEYRQEEVPIAPVLVGLHHRARSDEEHARLIEFLDKTHRQAPELLFVQGAKIVNEVKLKGADQVEYFGLANIGGKHHVSTIGDATINGQSFTVVMDTGSGITWVPGAACSDNACKNHEQLESNKDLKTVGGSVDITYGTGQMQGQRVVGEVTVGNVTVQNQVLLRSTKEDGSVFESGKFDGVMGYGRSALASVLNTPDEGSYNDAPFYINAILQKKVAHPEFSFYIGKGSNPGAMVLGGTAPEFYTGEINYHKGRSKLYWAFNIEKIAAGDHPDDEVKTGTKGSNDWLQGIADTGTSLMVLPKRFIGKLIHKLKVHPDCGNKKTLPDFHLWARDINDHLIKYTLTPEEYVLERNNKCETGIGLMDVPLGGDHPKGILGDIFLRSYYSVYNHATGQIGLAKSNHEHGNVHLNTLLEH